MSATTPVWVPLVIAVAGLTTTIFAAVLTQWYASRREDVRWNREHEERQELWKREDYLRLRQERLAAYTRLTDAMYEWDSLLRSAIERRREDARAEVDTTETERAHRVAVDALAQVLLLSPDWVYTQARKNAQVRESVTSSCLKPKETSRAALDKGWDDLRDTRKLLRYKMRVDLGLEPVGKKAGNGGAAEADDEHSLDSDSAADFESQRE